MESKCQVHERQPLMLFCEEERKALCLKCVPQHAGHTVMDFEDACKQLVVPRLPALRAQAEATLARLRETAEEMAA